MRKLLVGLALVAAASGRCFAGNGVITIENDTLLASTATYQQNLNSFGGPTFGVSRLSAQVVISSATASSKTFTDGTQSTGSITVVSTQPLVALAATDNLTIPSTALILGSPATAQITVVSTNGLTGAVITLGTPNQTFTLTNGTDWFSTSYASTTALSIAKALNSFPSVLVATAPTGSTIIYATASVTGVYGDSYTITTSTLPAISTSTFFFKNGLDPILRNAIFIVNGQRYPNGYLWSDVSGTSTGTALSVAAFLNTTGVMVATAPTNSTIVYATATVKGVAGNLFGFQAFPSNAFTIASSSFTGGQDAATLTINGVTLTEATDWNIGASSTIAQTAKSIATAINATSALSAIIVSTPGLNSAVVNSTSVVEGSGTNYVITTSTVALLVNAGAMSGGTDQGWNITSDIFTISSHGFVKGLPLLYSTGTVAIGGLTNQTTYYAIALDANTFKLATSAANAAAGSFIDITSSQTATTVHTYTLAPLAYSGTPTLKWQVSNDGSNWNDYTTTANGQTVTTFNFAPVFPSTGTIWDFGNVNYNYIRWNVAPPTQGGLNMKVNLNGSN